jgi:hypothetical protein
MAEKLTAAFKKSPRQQQGFSLLSILAAVIISIPLFTTLSRMTSDAHKQTKNTVTAQHLKTVSDAAVKYIQDNTAAVQGNCTATTPLVITIDMLKNTNYLAAAFSGVNPYAQTTQVEVLQPSPNNLDAKVITIAGNVIPDELAPTIATRIGAAGGYTPANTPTVAQGAFGGWTAPLIYNTQPGAGHLVSLLYFNNGQLVTDNLRRHSVPGHPELTSMYTPLNMRAKATANTSDALCVVGDDTTYGRIATDTNGAVLSCQLGIWKKQGLISILANRNITNSDFQPVNPGFSFPCPALTLDSHVAQYDYVFASEFTTRVDAILSGYGVGTSISTTIYIDTSFCSRDRGSSTTGETIRASGSAACAQTIPAGNHTLTLCISWNGIVSESEKFVGSILITEMEII